MHLSAIEIPHILLYTVYALYSNTVPVFDIYMLSGDPQYVYVCCIVSLKLYLYIFYFYVLFVKNDCEMFVPLMLGNVLDDPHHVKCRTTETCLITYVDQKGKWCC